MHSPRKLVAQISRPYWTAVEAAANVEVAANAHRVRTLFVLASRIRNIELTEQARFSVQDMISRAVSIYLLVGSGSGAPTVGSGG